MAAPIFRAAALSLACFAIPVSCPKWRYGTRRARESSIHRAAAERAKSYLDIQRWPTAGCISHHLLGTQEFLIINHTDCGMLTFKDEELQTRLERHTGTAAVAPAHFFAFSDLEENVRRQIQKVRSHPWIPKSISVRGFIYDVKAGRLKEVAAEKAAGAK